MAKFLMQLPEQILKDMMMISNNYEKIFGGMTKAGADVVLHNVITSIPAGIRNSDMMGCLKETKIYRTPSDDGINTKIGFYGYFTNDEGRTVPAPLVANLFEYGRSNSSFPKQPFFRKSFKKGAIEKAMLEAQKRLSGGLLE